MSPEIDTLDLIQSTFPGQDRLIGQAFKENRSFHELCEDYRRCVAVLERWKEPTGAEASQRREEYNDLLVELGQEIQSWLEEMGRTTSPPTGASPEQSFQRSDT